MGVVVLSLVVATIISDGFLLLAVRSLSEQ